MSLIDKIKEIAVNLDILPRYQTENTRFEPNNHCFNFYKPNGTNTLSTDDKIRIPTQHRANYQNFCCDYTIFQLTLSSALTTLSAFAFCATLIDLLIISFLILLSSKFTDFVYRKCYCWIIVQIMIINLSPKINNTSSMFSDNCNYHLDRLLEMSIHNYKNLVGISKLRRTFWAALLRMLM